MPLSLYALTAASLPEGSPSGAAGEALVAWAIRGGGTTAAGGAAPATGPEASRATLSAPPGGGVATDGELFAIAGEVPAPPRASEATLRAHDRTVRALAEVLDPLLPVRFGQAVASAAELAALLAPRRAALLAALGEVAGCVQITLRLRAPGEPAGAPGAAATVRGTSPGALPPLHGADPGVAAPASGDPEAPTPRAAADAAAAAVPPAAPSSAPGPAAAVPPAVPSPAPGPGARYLDARRAAARAAAAPPPWARPLLARLAPLVRAERVAPARPPFAATVYHLVPRRRLDDYRAALAAGAASLDPPPVASGPWPAWAFAPGLDEPVG